MKLSLKGKTRQRISIQMSDILPSIIEAVKEDLGLSKEDELHFTSNTTFITFDVIRTDAQRDKCQCRACMERRIREENIED